MSIPFNRLNQIPLAGAGDGGVVVSTYLLGYVPAFVPLTFTIALS